jgi:hypothetical protein
MKKATIILVHAGKFLGKDQQSFAETGLERLA